MGQSRAAFAAAVCILLAGCSSTGNAAPPEPEPTLKPRPVVETEMDGLLLSPEEASATMRAPMVPTESKAVMSDNSAIMAPPECLAIDGAAEAVVYANRKIRAEREQSLNNGNAFTNYLKQAVVLFWYSKPAAEFFESSVQQWPACHQYTHTQSGSEWVVGEITNRNGTLSTVATQQEAAAPGWACGRALSLRNNVIIDVNTCSADPGDSAVRIAEQIGAKVLDR
ncbi:sensor domain-containing protein [Mycolicibacterium mengxianglii]|uniref:sensor domain-containing protein n=1 Tax=Mycolicibacterium mengxianglii TaxID=2736649 RepID=UPI0018D15D56|nr:sensor domain-containing protein [Mycolicibacterium mengxianglii]